MAIFYLCNWLYNFGFLGPGRCVKQPFSCSHWCTLLWCALRSEQCFYRIQVLISQAKSCIAPAAHCFPTQGLSPGSIDLPGNFPEPESNGFSQWSLPCPTHSIHLIFLKSTYRSFVPTSGSQCKSSSPLLPPMQEVASVTVLSNLVEVFTLWLKERDRQTLYFYPLHSLGIRIYFTTLWGYKWCRYPH